MSRDPRYDAATYDFVDQVTKLVNESEVKVDAIALGLAQAEREKPNVNLIPFEDFMVGHNFSVDVWTHMIDEAFDEYVVRPWFVGLALPVTAFFGDGRQMGMLAICTMERTVVRFSYLPLSQSEEGIYRVSGQLQPLFPNSVKAQLDPFVTAVRRHVVHQG